MCLPLSHPLSSPFPFPLCVMSSIPMCVCHHSHVLSCLPSVCVRQGTCTVCVLLATHQHSALLSSFLSCLLFLSLFHHHHPHSWGHQRKREKEKGVWGKGERGRREVCHPKRHAKRQHKHSKKKTTPGVPTLSPTLVQTTPFHPSLHSSYHNSCFPLGVAVTVSPKAHTHFHINTRGEWFV